MPITPTNIPKNPITPSITSKGIGAYWGDAMATWGDAFFGWGETEVYINRSKSSTQGGSLLLENGFFLTLQDGSEILISDGGWINKIKN